MRESAIRAVPLLVLIGSWAISRWLKPCGAVASANPVATQRSWDRCWEDVPLARIWRVAEQRGWDAEILAEHFVRRVLEPIGDQEGIVLVEIAVVEDEQKFAAIRTEALDGMRNSGREIPEIADTDIVDEVPPCASTAVMRAVP